MASVLQILYTNDRDMNTRRTSIKYRGKKWLREFNTLQLEKAHANRQITNRLRIHKQFDHTFAAFRVKKKKSLKYTRFLQRHTTRPNTYNEKCKTIRVTHSEAE